MKVSRRHLIRMGAAIASASAATSQSPSRAAAGLAPPNLDPSRRILLKGGTIISMDAMVGDFVQGDILIQGKKIAAVGANLKVSPQRLESSTPPIPS
jgi:5-methylthioadenosine/S-adenosylhomocysteine deaminase